jgi:hypothetical protein
MEFEPITVGGILNTLKHGFQAFIEELEPVMMTPKEIQEQKMKGHREQHVQHVLPELPSED